MSLYTSKVGRPTLRAPSKNVSLRGFAISIFYEIEVDDIADLKVFSMQNYRDC